MLIVWILCRQYTQTTYSDWNESWLASLWETLDSFKSKKQNWFENFLCLYFRFFCCKSSFYLILYFFHFLMIVFSHSEQIEKVLQAWKICYSKSFAHIYFLTLWANITTVSLRSFSVFFIRSYLLIFQVLF